MDCPIKGIDEVPAQGQNVPQLFGVILQDPVHIPMQDTACLGLVHGMTQRDVVGREVGGRFMFGNACTPGVDSCQCMAKPIQYCKVK